MASILGCTSIHPRMEMLPFPPPVDHVLSELSTMTCLSWVALHGMAHSFNELCKPLCHDREVIHEGIRFKGLELVNSVPEELWTEVHKMSRKQRTKPTPQKKKSEKAKLLSEDYLQIPK